MILVKWLRIVSFLLTLAGALFLAADSEIHAQAQAVDPYTQAEKTAVNSTMIDQIQIHDAETAARFHDMDTRLNDMSNRISTMEGVGSGILGLSLVLQMFVILPSKWTRPTP